MIVGYGYVSEVFFGWYSEQAKAHDLEPTSPYWHILDAHLLQHPDAAVAVDRRA
jgi:hypothetical protein